MPHEVAQLSQKGVTDSQIVCREPIYHVSANVIHGLGDEVTVNVNPVGTSRYVGSTVAAVVRVA